MAAGGWSSPRELTAAELVSFWRFAGGGWIGELPPAIAAEEFFFYRLLRRMDGRAFLCILYISVSWTFVLVFFDRFRLNLLIRT
jgi:hypothetical protein